MSAVFAWHDPIQPEAPSLSFCCPGCENALTIHQPDPELPRRLLATCDECKAWYVMDPEGSDLIPIPGNYDSRPPG
ncbi:MAG: hypothetical protein ACLQVF_11605 [Isosphaeraceae bacterium]